MPQSPPFSIVAQDRDHEPTEDSEPRMDPLARHLLEMFREQSRATAERHELRLQAYDARDVKRDGQHAELVEKVGQVVLTVSQSSTEVRGLAEKVSASTTQVQLLAGKVPDRLVLGLVGSAFAFAGLLFLVILGLYAQSRGDDAGKAIDDAKRGMSGIEGRP